MTIGKNIQNARKEAGYTQKQLAEKCGVAEITIRQYELDKRQPRLEQLRKIADSLNITTKQLLKDVAGFWDSVSPEEAIEGLTYVGNGFYGKEAPAEMQEKFLKRMTAYQSRFSELMTQLNEDGQKEAVKRVEELTHIPKFSKMTDLFSGIDYIIDSLQIEELIELKTDDDNKKTENEE